MLLKLLVVVLFVTPFASRGQSLIVGIPSTDTTPEKKKAIAFEAQHRSWGGRPTEWAGFVFGTYGVSPTLELAVSAINLQSPRTARNESVIAGYKKSWLLREDATVLAKASVGQMAGASLAGRSLPHWNYFLLSQDFLPLGLRLHQGVSYANRSVYGQSAGSILLGVEQRLSSRWMIVADWFSGDHDYGALITAVQHRPTPHSIIFLGWKQPNAAKPGSVMTEMAYEF
jgi:hypothetical protein